MRRGSVQRAARGPARVRSRREGIVPGHMIEAKAFYRRIEALLERAEGDNARVLLEHLLPEFIAAMGAPLGVVSAQIYERRAGGLSLRAEYGAPTPDLSGELLRRLREDGGPGRIADLPWAGDSAAGPIGLFALAEESGNLVALRFAADGGGAGDPTAEQMLSVLSPLGYSIAQRLRRRELEDLIEQARAIQLSLLPERPPAFGDFDLAAASLPAQQVGGDFYDFLPLDPETLAITIADASGHGLPAALQARDVATGLRMGVERDFKIPRMVERLNRVIHHSGLVSRFISLVFGELEINGNFFYINAGHPPPLLLSDQGMLELTVGGLIVGPTPDAAYKLGFAHVDRGAALALYTDGVLEHAAPSGEMFGAERLAAWLTDWREGPGERAVPDLLDRLRAFSGQSTFEDDVTITYVRRPR